MADEPIRLETAVLTRLMHLNAMVTGIVSGLVAGLGLFVATNWLVIKGGPIGAEGEPIVGPHLWLLSNYFIGYTVSFAGSVIGFFYAAALGFAGGYGVAWVYNLVVRWKEARGARSR